MITDQKSWVEKIFPELKPEEVEQVEFNLEEFFNSILDVNIETNNKSENDHPDNNNDSTGSSDNISET